MRPSGRAPDQMRELDLRARLHPPRRRLLPGQLRRHARARHRVGRGESPAVPARQGPGLGHRRIWHAAARHPHPRQPRSGQGQAIGPDPGNPAADRPLAARGRRPAEARRAPDHRRLRRDPGRRRHPHGGDLGRLGGAAHRGRQAARRQVMAADPIRTQVAAVSCGIYQGTPVLDLDYVEDSKAGSDGNFVLTADGAIVEAQVTAEGETFDEEGLLRLLRLARIGCGRHFRSPAEGRGPMRPIGDKLVIATHNPGKLREIAALIAPLGHRLRRRRGARPARARGDRQHLRRQCRPQGARGGRPVRPARACRRQRTVGRCASRTAGDFLGALGRGRVREPRFQPRDGARLARSRSGRARSGPRRAFRLRAIAGLAQRRPDRSFRRARRRQARVAAARGPRLRLRSDVRAAGL